MNVSSDGRLCLNVIEKGYQATMPVVELIQTIKQLFLSPDETTVIDIAKYFQYRDARADYNRLASESRRLYAKSSVEEWIAGLTVEQDVPDTFSIEVGDEIPPYLRSAYTGKFIPKGRRVESPGGIVHDRQDLRPLLMTMDAPICPLTGRPLGNFTLDDL
jgi:hypothetical protein